MLTTLCLVSSEINQVDESGESLEQGNENDEICRYVIFGMQEINMKSIICCLPLFCCFFRGILENVLLDVDLSCSSETRSQE